MGQRAILGKFIPKAEGYPAQDAQSPGHPFILLFPLGKQCEQYIFHELHQLGTVLYHLERVEPV